MDGADPPGALVPADGLGTVWAPVEVDGVGASSGWNFALSFFSFAMAVVAESLSRKASFLYLGSHKVARERR
jgi:hypothetical protein